MVGADAVGGISGGAFNPAVTLGAVFMGLFTWGSLLAYGLEEHPPRSRCRPSSVNQQVGAGDP